jgi:Tfp pilus assembly protein PilV
MSHNKLDQKGFTAIEAVLILVILAIIGGTGYFVYHATKNSNKTLDTASNNSQSVQKQQPLTGVQATAKVQKTYDTYLAAEQKALAKNATANAPDTVQPVQVAGLAAVKSDLSPDFYNQVAPAKAGKDDIGCALYAVDSYKASLVSEASNKKTAVVGVDISAGDSVNGTITVTLNLLTGKITQITCPA